MKQGIIFTLFCLIFCQAVFAEEVTYTPVSSTAAFQNIPYEDCTKMYNLNKENLFYLTIGAINANKFRIEEVQTQNGYIIFSLGKNKYLATVAQIDKDNSMLKITPCNNLYYFQPGIITNIHKYIDLNKDANKQ